MDALIFQIYFEMKLYMFWTVSLSIIRSYSLYTQRWYMSYRFVGSIRTGSRCSILILLLESCLQTCMTYTIAEITVNNSWWWTEKLSEICRVSFQNKVEKLVRLVGFVIRKFYIIHRARLNTTNTTNTIHITTILLGHAWWKFLCIRYIVIYVHYMCGDDVLI
jgi:hypothetical protein